MADHNPYLMTDNLKTEVMGITTFELPPEINFCGNLSEV